MPLNVTMSGYLLTIYRNVTDFVTDNVTNRKTVTFKVTEKVTDKHGVLKFRLEMCEPQSGPQNELLKLCA